MVKRLISIFLILLWPGSAYAKDRVLTVQSVALAPYEEAVAGAFDVCPAAMDRVLLSESPAVPLMEQIQRVRPDLILAVGWDALKSLETVRDIPIVFVMLLCPDDALSGKSNITGVNMRASAEVQLAGIRKMLPDIRKVGAVSNLDQTGRFVRQAAVCSERLNLALVMEPVKTGRDVPAALLRLRGKVDLLWMIPDVTVMNSQAAESFLFFSLENKLPITTFSKRYLDMGALMAFELDAGDMGRQAGDMMRRILSGTGVSRVPVEDARSATISINATIGEKLGVRMAPSTADSGGR